MVASKDPEMEETVHRKRDPILDPPPNKMSKSAIATAVGVTLALHLGLGYWVWQNKFKLKELKFEEEKTALRG